MVRGVLSKNIYFPELYIEKSQIVLDRLKELRIDTIDNLRKEMIPISKLELQENQMWGFFEGRRLRGRSRSSLIFKKETTPQIAQLLGFIITDGSLSSTEGRVKLCQKELELILSYLKIINEEYCTKLTYSFDGKEANVGSIPLRYILTKYYGIPLGKKVKIVEVPYQISTSHNLEVLRRFIAGLFDGDGYVQYYYLKNGFLDHIAFCISTSSHKLVEEAVSILLRLGIKCSKLVRNDDKRMTLQTSGFENSLKFYQQIIPFIFHKKRKQTADLLFLGKDFAGKLFIPLSKELKVLFKEIRNNKLDSNLLDIESYSYVKSLRSIESWTYPSKGGYVRSIYVYKACLLLNRNPKEYIPSEHINFIRQAIK